MSANGGTAFRSAMARTAIQHLTDCMTNGYPAGHELNSNKGIQSLAVTWLISLVKVYKLVEQETLLFVNYYVLSDTLLCLSPRNRGLASGTGGVVS